MKKTVEDEIWNLVNDVATGLKNTDTATEAIKKMIQTNWEGKFIKGDFFFKTSTGYVSMNSLRRLHESVEGGDVIE